VDELRFDERVAIVTGAGGGLGRAHALLLASRGAQVVVNDLGGTVEGEGASAVPAQAVVDEIRALGGVAVADMNSVASAEGGVALVAHAVKEFGRVDIVVNNAGILRDKTLHNMTAEMFDAVLGVHLRGTFFVTQPAYVLMREQGHGRIVTTSSPAGLYGNFGQTNYASAKMAMVGFARAVAIEGARCDVKANVISPSALTRMTEGLTGDLGEDLRAELVSPVVAWLCHESCPVSGEIFAVGAGRVARVVIGETAGYANRSLTIEDVASHVDAILDSSQIDIPTDVASASALMASALER
jgi:NAD(P)-dependent dehydrogenase (short-subunit alcohol dehydrogenase family)